MEIDLSDIKNNIRILLTKTLNLKDNLNSDAFSRFREFFRGIPYRNLNGVSYPGASGAYSAGIPALDTLFGIKKLPMLSPIADEIRPRLVNDTYATVDTMRKSVDLVMKEGPLMEKFAGNPGILEQLKECVKIIHAYRMLHKASAEKFIPETTTMQDSGTGGALNVPAYLNAGIENTRKILK